MHIISNTINNCFTLSVAIHLLYFLSTCLIVCLISIHVLLSNIITWLLLFLWFFIFVLFIESNENSAKNQHCQMSRHSRTWFNWAAYCCVNHPNMIKRYQNKIKLAPQAFHCKIGPRKMYTAEKVFQRFCKNSILSLNAFLMIEIYNQTIEVQSYDYVYWVYIQIHHNDLPPQRIRNVLASKFQG